MTHHSRRIAFTALALFATPAAAAEPDGIADRFAHVRAVIEDYIAGSAFPSMTVAVAQNGRIVWEEGFGLADIENKVPATPNTLYSMASISKPITATGLMVLASRGRIDLDKPINDYLGEAKLAAYAGNVSDATVRRVANHTSGLPLHYQFFYEDEPMKRPAFEESIRRYGKLMAAPGKTYQYSNFGFGLIDHVVSRVSGKPYEQFMTDEVFKPLGLANVVAGRPSRYPARQVAKRYAPNGDVIPHYDFDHTGASAVYASAHDLVRFGMFYLKDHLPDQKPILSDAVIDEMLKPSYVPPNNPKGGYGIGWSSYEIAGHPARGHSGGMGGVSTDLTISPEHDIAIVVLVNAQGQRGAITRVNDMIHKALVPSAEKQRVFAGTFKGSWQGVIETYEGKVPVALTVADTDAHVRVGKGAPQLVPGVTVDDEGFLWLNPVEGDIGTADAGRYPYRLQFKLAAESGSLTGYVSAVSAALDGRTGNAMSYWVKLDRNQ